MHENREGFLYPIIDATKCVNCGLCKQSCPVNVNAVLPRFDQPGFFGGAAKSCEEVRTSTSGGVASTLSRQVIEDGGVVVGAAFDPFPQVRHVCVEDMTGIQRLKGSKYVESDITHALPKIRDFLDARRKVLFIGLPCQVAAVYGYLGGDRIGLYTIDLVCHGKSPQKLFSRWIACLERRLGGKICEYQFRNKKDCGWNDPESYRHFCRLVDGREDRISRASNWYGRYFLGCASLRHSCYGCRYAKLPRVADVTLADFWGADSDGRYARFCRDGLSLVGVQSEKGQDLVDRTKSMLDLVPCTEEFAIKCNRGLDHSSRKPVYRQFVFWFSYLPESLRVVCDRIVFGGASMVKSILGKFK